MSESDVEQCRLPHPELGYPCTEPKRHSGDHVSTTPDTNRRPTVWWNDYGKDETSG